MKKNKQVIRDRLDKLYSVIVRTRASGVCELCHKHVGFESLECHHMFGRGYSVRWLLNAGSGICIDCHQWCTDNPVKAREKYRQIRGEVWYNRTVILYRQTRSWKQWEMEELEAELATELQRLRNELR